MATGTVGETACVDGSDIGWNSTTCIDTELAYAALAGVVLKPNPHTVASGLPAISRAYSATIAGALSRVPATATAMPSVIRRLTAEIVARSRLSKLISQIFAAS